MNAKHTPGPWTLERQSGTFSIEGAPHGMLASIRYLGNTPERVAEETANARLIAAAPELLEALEEAYRAMQHPTGEQQEWKDVLENKAMLKARAAIAKAKGV